MNENCPDVVVVGGGFFGCTIALMLKQRGMRPVVVEAEQDLLTRASAVNQARVHGGYHYPRSLLTAYRSRVNYERFRSTYRSAIVDQFTKVYAVGRIFSKVTAGQFELFMSRIGAPLAKAPEKIKKIFNPTLTEAVWIAQECAFDYTVLRGRLRDDLCKAGIPVMYGIRVVSVHGTADGRLNTRLSNGSDMCAGLVFNAAYSGLNLLTAASNLPMIPLKHELTEMALLELPPELDGLSVTMMCGPFFSFMPYPARKLTTLSHVRYTPHTQWFENQESGADDPYRRFGMLAKRSNYKFMICDSSRYIPALRESVYHDSIWEVKTLLPQTEFDDGRPILFHRDPVLPAVVHVMGVKIDNIFDVEDEMDIVLANSRQLLQ